MSGQPLFATKLRTLLEIRIVPTSEVANFTRFTSIGGIRGNETGEFRP
jgi:hypothetical protein